MAVLSEVVSKPLNQFSSNNIMMISSETAIWMLVLSGFAPPLCPSSLSTSPNSSMGRVLDLKIRDCGFDSRAGQPNNY